MIDIDCVTEETKLSEIGIIDYNTKSYPIEKRYIPLNNCKMLEIAGTPWRVYYLPLDLKREYNAGFKAIALIPSSFGDDDATVAESITFHACFDGVRHMYVNSVDEGYINYPHDITKVFKVINSLCESFCIEGEWDEL